MYLNSSIIERMFSNSSKARYVEVVVVFEDASGDLSETSSPLNNNVAAATHLA